MKTYLLHREIFLPTKLAAPCFEGRLRYTAHARKAAQNDRYGRIALPEVFVAANAKIIEVEVTETGEIVKQVWRQPLDKDRDLILVIMPDGIVKTVWANLRSDKHKTLKASKYVRK